MHYPLTQIPAGFYINLPLGAVVAGLLLFVTIPESQYKTPVSEVFRTAVNSLDLPGFVLTAPAAIMFFLALQWGGNQHPWDSSAVIGLFIGADVTLIIILLWERRRGDGAVVPFVSVVKAVVSLVIPRTGVDKTASAFEVNSKKSKKKMKRMKSRSLSQDQRRLQRVNQNLQG